MTNLLIMLLRSFMAGVILVAGGIVLLLPLTVVVLVLVLLLRWVW